MAKIQNPFIVTGEIPDKYFCDREKETEWLISSITNGNNLVLMSPRRLGKTSLVEHCYNKKEIRDNYHTFYIDILPTTSLAELAYMLSKKIYDTLLPKGKKFINKFLSFMSSLKGSLGYDAISGMPTFTISAGMVSDPIMTLDEIFRYLSESDKPCIVTIDEFQQICKYPEKNVEALLRSYIQKIRNCNFIFSGSEQHIMTRMFNDSSRPFYNSAMMMNLREIPIDIFTGFIVKNFKDFNRHIDPEDAHYIYNIFDGNTFHVQRLCNAGFTNTPSGKSCTREIIDHTLQQMLDVNQTFFRERLSLVPPKVKPLLYAIAYEGKAESIFSADFINRHSLTSASAVQHAASQLIDSGLIYRAEDCYTISDKLFAIWIRRNIL